MMIGTVYGHLFKVGALLVGVLAKGSPTIRRRYQGPGFFSNSHATFLLIPEREPWEPTDRKLPSLGP